MPQRSRAPAILLAPDSFTGTVETAEASGLGLVAEDERGANIGATLAPGAAAVLDAVGFDGHLRRATAVVAGEGRIDHQSLAGKIVGEIAPRAARAGVPLHVGVKP